MRYIKQSRNSTTQRTWLFSLVFEGSIPSASPLFAGMASHDAGPSAGSALIAVKI
jgi:hypothetical protein